MSQDTWRLLTLTTNKTVHDTDDALRNINLAWNAFATVLRRQYPGIRYFKVLEVSDKKSVHLHIILNKYIPAPWIIKYWSRYWQSYIVDIKAVQTIKETLNYILKYVFKSTDNFNSNKIFYIYNKRRFSFSRSWSLEKPEKKSYTTYTKLIFSLPALFEFLKARINEGEIEFRDIFYDTLPDDLQTVIHDTIEANA